MFIEESFRKTGLNTEDLEEDSGIRMKPSTSLGGGNMEWLGTKGLKIQGAICRLRVSSCLVHD